MAAVVVLVVGLVFWTTRGDDPQNTANNTATSTSEGTPSPGSTSTPASDDENGEGQPSGVTGGGTGGGNPGNGAEGSNNGAGGSDGEGGEGAAGDGGEGQPAPIGDATDICPDQNLAVVLYTDRQTYQTGDRPVFTLVTTNAGLTKCVRDVGDAAQNVIVRTLDGTRTLWSARDCSQFDGVDNQELEPTQQVRNDITWTATTSNPGCDRPRVQVPPGSYQAIGKIGEKESAPITFNVVAPAQEP